MIFGSLVNSPSGLANELTSSDRTDSMNTKKYYLGLVLLIAVVTGLAMKNGYASPGEEDRSKLIKFSHRFHIEDLEVECADCHGSAWTSSASSDKLLSNHSDCSLCHEQEIEEDCLFCHTTDEYAPFKNPVRELTFSHAEHVVQEIECIDCHKGLETVDFAAPANLPDMNACVTCHESEQQSLLCESCHTDFVSRIPKNHWVANFKKEHKQTARLATFDAQCASCHAADQCQDCHDGAFLNTFGRGGDPLTPVSPRSATRDDPNQMVLQKVHDLNYRFTHGIDAKARMTDCFSCHSEEAFCSDCHAEGNILQSSIKPDWHNGPGFVTIGAGTGGGRHAGFARRDIENCAACHDVQGSDPTCIICHVDPDGFRGTNPNTHSENFMASEEGFWHSDPGAICYNCHTDPNAHPNGVRGMGFCGYCHL